MYFLLLSPAKQLLTVMINSTSFLNTHVFSFFLLPVLSIPFPLLFFIVLLFAALFSFV